MPHPELIHRVKGWFNAVPDKALKIYNKKDFNWRQLDATHLLFNWRPKNSNLFLHHFDGILESILFN